MANVDPELLGAWKSAETGSPGLEFTETGEVSGTDGCNRIVSSYAIEDERVKIEQFATTKMACKGVDTWLGGAREVALEGDTLHILNGEGVEIGELQRDA